MVINFFLKANGINTLKKTKTKEAKVSQLPIKDHIQHYNPIKEKEKIHDIDK